MLHKHEITVLRALISANGRLSYEDLIKKTGLGKDSLNWAINSLKEKGAVKVKESKREIVQISEEGMAYARQGLPEERLMQRLESSGSLVLSELKSKEDQLGLQWLKAKGLAKLENGRLVLVKREPVQAGEALRQLAKDAEAFSQLKQSMPNAIKELLSRHLVSVSEKREIESVELTEQGKAAASQGSAEIVQLTSSMIKDGSWRGKTFAPYNLSAKIEPASPAREHLLRRIINRIRLAYLGMGFEEIEGPIVEPAFWVFDYLFVPQDHPARDVQDTFFVESPSHAELEEKELANHTGRVHERSWHLKWQEEIASQVVLRPHTTSVSGRFIYKIMHDLNKNPNAYSLPIKLFTIGRVFRNENIDYKHLADFYQTDGIIIGKDLTLSELFDTLIKLYKALGVEVKFKPSYFPFVEPGVEVDAKLGDEWLEMGGAGVIRREVTGSRRKNIRVLAWGLGIERIALAENKSIGSIAHLYTPSLGWLRKYSLG
ncbi:MAG: phenylalanine--tRNA ligase subunit alpha [Candidatus Micrarchaeia archaeon]